MGILNVVAGIKSVGGFQLPATEKTLYFVQGQHCVLTAIFTDSDGRPMTLTNYTVKMRMRKQDDTVLVVAATPFDNNKGEVEIVLTAAASLELKVGKNQVLEFEAHLTAQPDIKTFVKASAFYEVMSQALPVA